MIPRYNFLHRTTVFLHIKCISMVIIISNWILPCMVTIMFKSNFAKSSGGGGAKPPCLPVSDAYAL